jgi:hypothetical protein
MITAKQLYGRRISARDGHIGAVDDLYFDDHAWTVRYLVIDTGKWLPGRKVLIVPDVIIPPWHDETDLPVDLTKEQIKSSPDIDTAQPVSRNAEQLLYSHYGWSPYWLVPGLPAPPPPPPLGAASEEERREASEQAESISEQHLRSTKEVAGYRLLARDGEIGHVRDFIFDDDCRRILFLAVDLE